MTTDEMAKAVIMHLTGRPEEPTPMLLKMLDDFKADDSLLVAASDDLFRHAIKIRNEALRKIAFWTPTVCYEHDDRRYVDIEEVFTLKRIAADSDLAATEDSEAAS